MADIEQAKSDTRTVEFMESSDSKEEIQMVSVDENIQTRIRRKV